MAIITGSVKKAEHCYNLFIRGHRGQSYKCKNWNTSFPIICKTMNSVLSHFKLWLHIKQNLEVTCLEMKLVNAPEFSLGNCIA